MGPGPAEVSPDHRTATGETQNWPRRALVFATATAGAASLVFEQSPANEMIRTNVGLEALKRTGSAAAVGLVVAGATVVIEMVSALLITAALHQQGGAVQAIKRRMIRKADERSEAIGSTATPGRAAGFGADAAIALGLGAGLVTLRRHVADPNPSVRRDIRVSCQATAVIAVVSGTIGYLLGGGLANADRVGLGRPAGWIIDYGTDTRFWVSVLVIGYLSVVIWRRLQRRRARPAPAL